ncbi:MAG: hypothetical protein JRM73_03175 [Nitrososphaerota archaeon]|nr:hypothetical protein [Nitrososphaerota archaeon]
MKRSQLLAVTVLALFLFAALPAQQAHAQSSYTEKLSAYVAGSDALWYFTFGGVNGSSHLSALEASPGLSWYNITAVSTAGWQSDFQVFGPRGYNILPFPYATPQGLFLTVGSDTYADASAAATAVDSYLLTNFVSMSNGTGTFSFYSPVSFSSLIPSTLLRFLPTTEHGFASAITSSFLSTPSPFVVLEGVKSGSSFEHSLVVGSIAYSALSSAGAPALLTYFGGTVSSLAASNNSASSVVNIVALDGVMQSSDSATVTSDSGTFTSSYTLPLSPGKHISAVNATVVEQTAPLLATRAVDTGVLRTGNDVSVTLSFTDLSSSLTVSNLTFTDNWWSAGGNFKLLGGVDNVTSATLSPGQTTTPVYRLEYTGSAVGPLTIPASVVSYQYQVDGKTFNSETTMNPITISLGQDAAVVYATVEPVGGLGKSAGAVQDLNVTVVNVGTLPASSVVVAGQSIAGLAAQTGGAPGGSASVTVTQSATNLANVNVTRSYDVTYQDPSGTTFTVPTNVVSDVFSQVSMVTGFPVLQVGASITPLSAAASNVTLAFASSNLGTADVTSYKVTGTLPAALGCGTLSGPGISCSGDQLTISIPSLNQSTTERAYMTYNLTTPANFILSPFSFQGVTSGASVSGMSNLAAVPAGLQLSKTFAPSQLFGGMSSSVTASAVNAGPYQIYNLTLKTTADSFDALTSTTPLTQTGSVLNPDGNLTFSYPVATSQLYGAQLASAVTASGYFAGTSFPLSGLRPSVEIYQPLNTTISTYPITPEEGKTFTITFTITNPSAVSVSDVNFTLPIPAGLSLSDIQNAQATSKLLTITAGTLAGGGNVTATARAVASSGITVPFADAKLTFSYAGTTVVGGVPSSTGIAIAEDVTTRYLIPIAFIVLVMLAVAFYVRRMVSSVPSSQK